jgi:tetratricopeptide (TPR) repeat protein
MLQPSYYLEIPCKFYARRGEKVHRGWFGKGSFLPRIFVLFAVIFGLFAGCWARTVSSTTQPSADQRIDAWIAQLNSDNADDRKAAANALINLREASRPAILKLIKSTDPGLRKQAQDILLALPWYTATDPPKVKQLLLNYGAPDIETRRVSIGQLAGFDDQAGLGALTRLLTEDPSPAVQWTIVECLREQGSLDGFQSITPAPDDSRQLAVCGYARLSSDVAGAMDYLSQCAELEFAEPTDDDGEFDFVIRFLADAECQQKRYDEAADWRRKEIQRGSTVEQSSGIPQAMLELFALQANFGPLKGLESDIRTAGADIQKPMLQYTLAEMYARTGQAAKAQGAQSAAFAGSTNRMQRYYVGEYLYEHGWDVFAEGELRAYLKRDPADVGSNELDFQQLTDANVHLALGAIAVRRDDDETAAKEKEQAMLLMGNGSDLLMTDHMGHQWKLTPDKLPQLWGEIYWRYLRAAVAGNNQKEINRRLEQLLGTKPTDTDIAIDIVPLLRSMGRTSDADLLFGWSYDSVIRDLDSGPNDPEKLNEAAWLCAKCDRHLPEARTWAEKAVALAPNDAAIIDTLAEVYFHLGRADLAAIAEAKALSFQPGDPYMTKQLAKYQDAAKSATTRPN